MGEYYDKEKFTGGRNPAGSGRSTPPPPPPRRPYQTPPQGGRTPPKQPGGNSGWYSWPVIIILFSLGVWPIALVLLFFNLFGDSKKRSASGRRDSSANYDRQHGAYTQQAESAVERAMRKAESRMDSAESKVDQAVERAMEQMGRTLDRAARQVEQAGRSSRVPPPPPVRPTPPVKPVKPVKQKKQKAKPAGVLLRLIGIIFMAVAGMVGLDFLSEVVSGYYIDMENFFAATGFGFAGALMFFRGHYLNKMSRRSQRYILAIGNVDAMPIEEIAKRVNRKPAQAIKELQKLIDKGYLGEDAYIDHERGYFLRFGAVLEEEEEEAPFEPAPAPTPKEAQEGYSGILRDIRHANDRIADPELSRKIDRLEQISGLIFKEVEEHPEKRASIHTFFDYYLPTTQKLLDTYADFEETGVEGEHLREAKSRIEQTMDLIVSGFEHQLDQLYSSDAMDVATDIKVMEAMLKRDTASTAKDFGYGGDGPHLTLDPDGDRRDKGGQTQAM
ncbi:MAG: hypothetical protein HFF69_08610 [Oscillospiraceae bacterium]|jgi:DNA-binding Lrp family transcriptional regulator|nr:hypothetical protein [Oscillospiraceae bacterium]